MRPDPGGILGEVPANLSLNAAKCTESSSKMAALSWRQ
jgi:hypothetical protein